MQRRESGFQDSLVSSSQEILHKWNGPSISGLRSTLKPTKDGKLKGAKESVWLRNFLKLCSERIGNINLPTLINEITLFTDKVAKHVAMSYSSPKKAARTKVDLLLVLQYFHYQYTDLNLMLDDESEYLEKMTHLVTMYLDMEVKASKRGLESVKKITSKLVASLFLFLRSSSEHIMDAILSSQLLVNRYREIWFPILQRATGLPITEDLTYVRCLLLFKLWRRFSLKGEKSILNEAASAKLCKVPDYVLDNMQRGLFIKVLPLLPANTETDKVTKFYMKAKFNVQDSIKGLFKWMKETKEDEIPPIEEEPLRLFDETTENDNLVFFDNYKEDDFMGQLWSGFKNDSSLEQDEYKMLDSISNKNLSHQSNSKLSESKSSLGENELSTNLCFEPKTSKVNSQKSKSSRDVIEITSKLLKKSSAEKENVGNSKKKARKEKKLLKAKLQEQESFLTKLLNSVASQQTTRDNISSEVPIEINDSSDLEEPCSEATPSTVEDVLTVKESACVVIPKPLDMNSNLETESSNQRPKPYNMDSNLKKNPVETLNETLQQKEIEQDQVNLALQAKNVDQSNVSLTWKLTSTDNFEKDNLESISAHSTNVDLHIPESTYENSKFLKTVEHAEEIISAVNEPVFISGTDCKEVTNEDLDLNITDDQLEPSVTVIKAVNSVNKETMEPSQTNLSDQPQPDSIATTRYNNNKENHTNQERKESAISKTTIESSTEENKSKLEEGANRIGFGVSKNKTIDVCNQPQKLRINDKCVENKLAKIQHNIVANKPSQLQSIDSRDMKVDGYKKQNQTNEANNKSTRLNISSNKYQTKVAHSRKVKEFEQKSTQCVRSEVQATTKVEIMQNRNQITNICGASSNNSTVNPPSSLTSAKKVNIVENQSTKLFIRANMNQIEFDANTKETHVTKDCKRPSEKDSNKTLTLKDPKELQNDSLIDQVNTNIQIGEITITQTSNKSKPNKDNPSTIIDRNNLISSECNKGLKHRNGTEVKDDVNTKLSSAPVQTLKKPTETVENKVVNTKKSLTPIQTLGKPTLVNFNLLKNNNWILIKNLTQVEHINKQTNTVVTQSSRDHFSVNVVNSTLLHQSKCISQQNTSITASTKGLLGENKSVSTNDGTITGRGVSNVSVCQTPSGFENEILLPQDRTTDSSSVNAANDTPTTTEEIKSEFSASDCRLAVSCSKFNLNTNTSHSIDNLLYSEPANIVNTYENLDVGQEVTIKQEFEDQPSFLSEDLRGKGSVSGLPLSENATEVANTKSPLNQSPMIGSPHKPEVNTCLLHKILGGSSSQDACHDCILEQTKTHRVESNPRSSQLQPQEIRREQWETTSTISTKPLGEKHLQSNLTKGNDLFVGGEQMNSVGSPSGFEIIRKNTQESSLLTEDCGSESGDSNLVIDEEADCAKDPNAHSLSVGTYPSDPKSNQESGDHLRNLSNECRSPDITRDLRTQSSLASGHDTSMSLKRERLAEECMQQRNVSVPIVDKPSQNSRSTGSGLVLLQKAAQLEQELRFPISRNSPRTPQVMEENYDLLPLKKIKLTHPNNLAAAGSPQHWQQQLFSPEQTSERFSLLKPSNQWDSTNMNRNSPLLTGQVHYMEMQQNCLIGSNVMRSPPAHCNNTSPSLSMTYQHRNSPEIQKSYNSRISTSPHFDKPINILPNAYQSIDQTKQQYYEISSVNSLSDSIHSSTAASSQSGYSKQNIGSNIAYANANIDNNLHKSEYLAGSMNARSDPLCLVVNKNKEDSREQLYDFDGFTVAQEVEVCSAPEVTVSGDWTIPVSSEISDPNWPIAEQSVVDNSSIPTREQFLYTPTPPVSSTTHYEESDAYFFKDSIELNEIVIDFKNPEHFYDNYEELMELHMQTLHVDYDLCTNQKQFKDYYTTQDLPPTIPVPFPTKVRKDLPVRCSCTQCDHNQKLLFTNYQMLTNFFKSKVKFNNPKTPEKSQRVTESPMKATEIPIEPPKSPPKPEKPQNITENQPKPPENPPKPIERPVFERDHSCDNDCSLPLKKRKTMTHTNITSMEQPKMMSYPNTPMISIAALEQHPSFEQRNQVIVSNPQSPWKPPAPSFPVTRQASLRIAQNLCSKPPPQEEVKTNKRKPSRRRRSHR